VPLEIQKFQTIAENVEWVGGWVGIHAMVTLGIAFTMVVLLKARLDLGMLGQDGFCGV